LKEVISDPDQQSSTFGAPVLSASTGEEAVIEDPTWTPPESSIKRLTERPKPALTKVDDSQPDVDSAALSVNKILGITVGVIFGAIILVGLIGVIVVAIRRC